MTESGPLPDAGMYRMFDGYLVTPDRAGPGSAFSRISFRLPQAGAVKSGTGGVDDVPAVRIAVADSIPFPSYGEVVASSVVDDARTGCQQVWFVRQAGGEVFLDRVTLGAAGALGRTTFPLGASWVRSIAGEAVLATKAQVVLVAGASDQGVVVGAFDTSSGKLTGTWTLPGSPQGPPAGSWIVVQDFTTWVFVTVRTAGALSTLAVPTAALRPGEPLPAAEVHHLPRVDLATGSGVDATLGRMLPGSAGSQLILAAAGPSGAPFVVMQGFDAGKPAQLAVAVIDTAFAKPRSGQYRVTCADLDNNGQEELVLAYPADYGGVAGAAAFVLLRFDAQRDRLEASSRYVAAGPGGAPLASLDLRLGSGVLGDAVTSGVFVLGAGGDLAHIMRGEAQVFAGIVPVDPVTLRFPPYAEAPAMLPAVTQVGVTGLKAPGILGSVVDLAGLSVMLGPPVLTQLSSRGQLLAILQVPPFDRENVSMAPSLIFSESDNRVKGLSVTSSKDWVMSDDAGLSLGVSSSALSFHLGKTYGHGFSHTEDSSTSVGVAISRTPTQLDRLVTMSVDYSVWRYPIVRRSRGSEPGGTLMVIFPGSSIPVQGTPIAYDRQFGYRTAYEPGVLLSYLNVELDGWDETKQGELLLFTPLVSLEVTNDQPDTNTYDRSDANQDTIGKHYFVASSASSSANLLANTNLFSYLPVSFGFNLGSSETFSESEMEMTSLSRTESLSISVSGGTVPDASFRFTVTPYIYQHAGLGALVVAFKVGNLGPGWRSRYANPYPMLMLPFRHQSQDPLEKIFSRSIGFEKQPDGTVHIVVEVFNHGFTDAELVTVRAHVGQPRFEGGRPVIPSDTPIGEVQGRVVALGRQRLRVKWAPPAGSVFVTAVVWGGPRTIEFAEIAWNVYPESAFEGLDLPGIRDA
ncbi:hypothetical protein ACQEUU_00360 [Nonomuraea sp. CA-218870]|uniref:hypothetical protein n=1 Tax=Nonomuraea sp. CA-218870 TaxID=3239998 RepID=UPI003D91BC4D